MLALNLRRTMNTYLSPSINCIYFNYYFICFLQLYVKARGLPDTLFKTYVRTNGEPGKYTNIHNLLKLLDAPVINTKPLHLEFILKMEGKAVLSYYLNEKTFQKLTYRDSEYPLL